MEAGSAARVEARDMAAERPLEKRKKKPPAGAKTPWWLWLAVGAIVVFCLFPFYWLINISLKTGPDLASSSLVPPSPSLDNYEAIFQNADFTRALLNSAIVSITTTI